MVLRGMRLCSGGRSPYPDHIHDSSPHSPVLLAHPLLLPPPLPPPPPHQLTPPPTCDGAERDASVLRGQVTDLIDQAADSHLQQQTHTGTAVTVMHLSAAHTNQHARTASLTNLSPLPASPHWTPPPHTHTHIRSTYTVAVGMLAPHACCSATPVLTHLLPQPPLMLHECWLCVEHAGVLCTQCIVAVQVTRVEHIKHLMQPRIRTAVKDLRRGRRRMRGGGSASHAATSMDCRQGPGSVRVGGGRGKERSTRQHIMQSPEVGNTVTGQVEGQG